MPSPCLLNIHVCFELTKYYLWYLLVQSVTCIFMSTILISRSQIKSQVTFMQQTSISCYNSSLFPPPLAFCTRRQQNLRLNSLYRSLSNAPWRENIFLNLATSLFLSFVTGHSQQLCDYLLKIQIIYSFISTEFPLTQEGWSGRRTSNFMQFTLTNKNYGFLFPVIFLESIFKSHTSDKCNVPPNISTDCYHSSFKLFPFLSS